MGRTQTNRGEKDKEKKNLRRLYTTPRERPAFGGLGRLVAEARKTHRSLRRRSAEDWARGVEAYTLHKPARKKFRRRKTIVSGLGIQLQADLLDVSSNTQATDDTRYLLTIIDCF